ncbi:DUF6049 family protein [Microbacterium sp. SA39]|uniref:DUF6049 family protein n=1 Tax=Microbacterium sp. SA39 TaxID=1263625 RepID=UPI0005FA1F2E|nr:DUF6049 family protein [Microbacterium sp. SA39]KJQ52580.1 hypothetical protein RS85_03473 [Microbacterium sp. SA39]
MSVKTPETGFRARLQQLARRTAVFAIALTLACVASPGAVSAAETPPADDEQSVELYVSAGLRGTIAPGSSTSALLSVRNRTDSELTAGRVRVEIGTTPLVDDEAVSTWFDDEEAAGEFTTLGTEGTEPIDAGESSTATVFVPETTIGELSPGIYPLRAELTGATTGGPTADDEVARDTTATSVLVVAATSASLVGVLVPITATPADGALLTTDELAALTAPEGSLTAQLDGVAGTTAVLAIDPSIPAAIRVLGTAAPEQATEWLARLDELPNARFALQFGDADAAVQAQAQLPELLQPLTFAPFLDPANFPLAPATDPPATATAGTTEPTPAPSDAPPLPDDEELTAVDGALPRILWPRAAVSPDDLAAFAGYLGEGTTTIVSSSTVGGQSAARAEVDGHDLLVTDAAASAALSDAAAEADPAARQRLLAESAARIFLAEARAPGAPLLLGLEREETRAPDALREAISAADSIGFDLGALRETAPAAATISVEPDTTGVEHVANLLADEQALGAFSSILADPQVLLSPERIRILRTLAVSTPPEAFTPSVEAHRALTTATLGAVSIPPSSTIQLLSANADLPIRVRNDLPWPVTVQLTASPTDPRLEVKPLVETVVQANSTLTVKVPVSARVGSGEVDLRLALHSPTGVLIQGDQIMRVAVRADWETIGLGVLGTLVVLLISFGVLRTVRRKRREAAEAADVESAAALDAAALEAAEPKDGRGE